MKVKIEPHNPTWLLLFQKTKATLQEILKDIPYISIEHIGSTSIPGLPSKPVLDIDIIATQTQFPLIRNALVQAGYHDCGEMNVPGRHAFRQPGHGDTATWRPEWIPSQSINGKGEVEIEMRRNTYVMIEGCEALRNHLDVKRVLMEDGLLRDEYGRVKRELGEREWEHIGEYATAKNEVLRRILERAGWGEEGLDGVGRVNDASWRKGNVAG